MVFEDITSENSIPMATIIFMFRFKANSKIFLCSSDDVKIVESVNGKETGYFILDADWNKKVGQTISGKWYSLSKSVSYPVVLKVIAKAKE